IVSRSASRSSRILSLSVMRMCGMESAELIWFAIAVSFFRYSSSRSSEEGAAWTVMGKRMAPAICDRSSTAIHGIMTAETAMKPIHILTILLILTAAPLFAARRNANIVDDVIRMQKPGIAEDEIIPFVHKGDPRLDVTADDMIALHDAGVSRNVIKAILDESDARGERRDGNRGRDYGYSYTPSFSYGYYGVPYFYDPWYYN